MHKNLLTHQVVTCQSRENTTGTMPTTMLNMISTSNTLCTD